MLRQLVTIVRPETVQRWIREEDRGHSQTPPKKRGRPRTPEDIRALILKFAAENGWGMTRIMGEIKKLGIKPPSKSTIKRILRSHGFNPESRRGPGTWAEFLHRQAASLWQCDFLSRRIVTLTGFRYAFVLVFINIKTRRVIHSPATLHPNDAWMTLQTARFVSEVRRQGLPVKIVQHDRDTKFGPGFRNCLENAGIERIRNGYRTPNLNAFVERFIQSLQQECLDHFLVMGLRHFDHLCREYLAYYHEDRPHQNLDNETILKKQPITPRPPGEVLLLDSIECRERLGGLLKSYNRKAA
jgi:putative transposase